MATIRTRENKLNLLVLTEIDIEISVPSRRIGILADTNLFHHTGTAAIGKDADGNIFIGIKTDADFQFGVQLTVDQAKIVADLMREVTHAA